MERSRARAIEIDGANECLSLGGIADFRQRLDVSTKIVRDDVGGKRVDVLGDQIFARRVERDLARE